MPQSHPPSALTPGFILLQSNRLEVLRQLLIDWLKTTPLAPLENETVLVQSNGMAQWLKLGMASARAPSGGGLGIATGIETLFPARLQWQCYRAIFGADAVPQDSPLDKNLLVWRLMRLLPAELNTPEFKPLRHYIQTDDTPDSVIDERRLYQLALRLADQFDQYQVYRADWLLHWQQGHVTLPPSGLTQHNTPLDAEQQWQPRLWQALIQEVQAEQPEDNATQLFGRADLHLAFVAAANQHTHRPVALPRRIIVFGLSAIAPQILDVLAVIARWTQVIVCLQNPCQHYWGDIIDGHQLFATAYRGQPPRKHSPQKNPEDLHTQANPLLAAWGRQGRDLMRLLDAFEDQISSTESAHNLSLAAFESPTSPPATPSLLAQIQDDILELRNPDELQKQPRRLMPSDSPSVQFHIAHSPLREVEILHDQLLAALQTDTSLNPADIIVMVPDMAIYAPSIAAIFGRIDRQSPRYIPFSVADQATSQQAPLLGALNQLLTLPHARIGRSEMLDLLAVPRLRARFGIKEADLPTLHTWINEAGIRWGIDAAHREQFGLPAGITQNTWMFGLNRLLLGYLSGDAQALWQSIEPYPAMDASNAALIGYLADFIEQINRYTHQLAQTNTPQAWHQLLNRLMADFFLEPSEWSEQNEPLIDNDLEAHERLLDGLARWQADCQSAHFTQPITLETARHAWLNRLEPHRLQQRFLVGGVNFATLMPMRAIPYRHIYLLGMDDASYPRRQPPSDFDLMASRYRPGDRARRDDDRYLFLEALLAAREKFVISWVGRHIRNNQKRPACVMVSQLQDYLDQFWHSQNTEKASETLTTHHPLHPYSHPYFSNENPALFTYADDWRALHTQLEPAAQTSHECPAENLPLWRPERSLSPKMLGEFLRAPTHVLFKERFNITFPTQDGNLEDHEPFTLNNLELWQIKQQLNDRVRQRMATEPQFATPTATELQAFLQQQYKNMQLSGQRPIISNTTADELIAPLLSQWERWQNLAQHFCHPETNPPNHNLTGHHGLTLEATIDALYRADNGAQARLIFIEGKLHPSDDISPQSIRWEKCAPHWPSHLSAQLIGKPVHTYLIGQTGTVCLTPVAEPEARQHLIELLDAWFDAAQGPYPIACKTAFCWLENQNTDPNTDPNRALDKAKICFQGSHNAPGERANDDILARTWTNFNALIHTPSSQKHTFTELCQQLYQPMRRSLLKNEPDPSPH
ncbi:MAG: exodeoxyribonuclease V subunit gamma [Halothiobacillus sp. 24-54-40]|jgi:exodeoxyribonuclease V gamma subunit|nr:MAG: exodeoxyribonuclease V subunit gamma [Halothiobacillus sp. 24-54-40]HQS01563.1 exodeoxyribonuclease V subunit gamma [Halothiobacillus sp.]HQS28140.1 exodeoxyribonuclease V subunit gamma [Halothiobacillus sp.]